MAISTKTFSIQDPLRDPLGEQRRLTEQYNQTARRSRELMEVFRLHDADAARQRAIRFLRQRGRYCLDQKVHRIGSPAWERERRRQARPPEVPRFLLRA